MMTNTAADETLQMIQMWWTETHNDDDNNDDGKSEGRDLEMKD